MLYHCAQCGEPFQAAPAAKRKFCSRACWRKSLIKKIKHTCERCGEVFLATPHNKRRFCSTTCTNSGWDEPCAQCGVMVRRTPHHAKRFENVFCSRECYGLWKRKRVEHTCPQCGICFSRKLSESDSRYCSQSCYDVARAAPRIKLRCQQCDMIFEHVKSQVNPNMYQGKYCSSSCMGKARRLPDSARSVYSHEFTEVLKGEIRQRDNDTCQLCDKPQEQDPRTLAVHHIDYDKTNNHPDNLITLCHSCHSKTNYSRNHWENLFASRF